MMHFAINEYNTDKQEHIIRMFCYLFPGCTLGQVGCWHITLLGVTDLNEPPLSAAYSVMGTKTYSTSSFVPTRGSLGLAIKSLVGSLRKWSWKTVTSETS